MLQLGVAGVGPRFVTYREVLRRLRNPVAIDAVYDCVFARAAAAAAREDAALESGLRALAGRHSVDAVLLLDPGWHELAGLLTLSRCRKPVFVASWMNGSSAEFQELYETATAQGVCLMPALWRRYLPVAVRVQELIATGIGAVSEIDIAITVSANDAARSAVLLESLTGWLDFCRKLFRAFPIRSRIELFEPGRATPQSKPARAAAHQPDTPLASSGDCRTARLIVDYPPSTGEATGPPAATGTVPPVPSMNNPAMTGTPRRMTGHGNTGRRAIVQLIPENGVDVCAALRAALAPSCGSAESDRNRPTTSPAPPSPAPPSPPATRPAPATGAASTSRSGPAPRSSAQASAQPPLPLPPVRIVCERGWARIQSALDLAWQIDGQAAASETLTADRSEHDIMIDLFCRRVAGGLVPVPDFLDVSQALRMVEDAARPALNG